MNGIKTIARKELRTYFLSPVALIFLLIFLTFVFAYVQSHGVDGLAHRFPNRIYRVVLVAVVFLFFWGGPGVHGFSFALLCGIIVGTYSSIGIASPLLPYCTMLAYLWWTNEATIPALARSWRPNFCRKMNCLPLMKLPKFARRLRITAV